MKRKRSNNPPADAGLSPWIGALIIGSIVLVAGITTYSYSRTPAARGEPPPTASAAVQARARELIRYADMALAPEQQAIKAKVLGSMPAYCCKKFPLLKCCCPCNLSKTVWGLSNYLIVVERADAARLRTEVKGWIERTNPGGYSGDGCFHGGCKRPFNQNGCGGMDQANVLF